MEDECRKKIYAQSDSQNSDYIPQPNHGGREAKKTKTLSAPAERTIGSITHYKTVWKRTHTHTQKKNNYRIPGPPAVTWRAKHNARMEKEYIEFTSIKGEK